MKELYKNHILKEEWFDGHHKVFWIDLDTGIKIADANEVNKISYEEYLLRKECRSALLTSVSNLFGKVFTNTSTNMKARFSKNTASKISSDKAITKSVVNGFSVQEHFEAAENLKGIFETADFIGTFSDTKNDPNIVAIHRFQKEIELSNGKKCVAYLTLKEVKLGGTRIYTQELLLNKYPQHEAGEVMSRGLIKSESTAYKCSPRTT